MLSFDGFGNDGCFNVYTATRHADGRSAVQLVRSYTDMSVGLGYSVLSALLPEVTPHHSLGCVRACARRSRAKGAGCGCGQVGTVDLGNVSMGTFVSLAGTAMAYAALGASCKRSRCRAGDADAVCPAGRVRSEWRAPVRAVFAQELVKIVDFDMVTRHFTFGFNSTAFTRSLRGAVHNGSSLAQVQSGTARNTVALFVVAFWGLGSCSIVAKLDALRVSAAVHRDRKVRATSQRRSRTCSSNSFSMSPTLSLCHFSTRSPPLTPSPYPAAVLLSHFPYLFLQGER